MSSWTPRRVLDALVAVEWSPDGATEVLTDDYRLIRYPDWALDPAFPAAQVTRSRTGRAVAEIIDEVAVRVRRWHLPGVESEGNGVSALLYSMPWAVRAASTECG